MIADQPKCAPSQNIEWQRGGKQHVLTTYARLHQGRIGQHWLWAAIERIAAGDSEEEVMLDFGYQKVGAGDTAQEVLP